MLQCRHNDERLKAGDARRGSDYLEVAHAAQLVCASGPARGGERANNVLHLHELETSS